VSVKSREVGSTAVKKVLEESNGEGQKEGGMTADTLEEAPDKRLPY